MDTNEIIKLLLSKYPIYSLYGAEKLLDKKAYKVSNQQDLKEYRHYAIATDVYECTDGFVGITGPCRLYNEHDTWKDINYPCKFSEYVEKCSISYIHK